MITKNDTIISLNNSLGSPTLSKHQSSNYDIDTLAIISGRASGEHHGVVNTPVYRASTILHSDARAFETRHDIFDRYKVVYGLLGTPTTFALEEAMIALTGGHDAVLTSSGLSAVTISLLSFVSAGDHLLMTDSAYWPTRAFCDQTLSRFGVDVTYYDPTIGADIESLIRPNTRVIFLESPGSMTFEVQDIPAITKIARNREITTLLDATWATPLYFDAFGHDVDVAIHAATKYLVGHSDVLLGVIVSNERAWEAVRQTKTRLGEGAGPDEVYLTTRGLRTLPMRLKHHHENGLTLARWLEQRPEVACVLHPALPGAPGHDLFKRDFSGACGLFGVILKKYSTEAVRNMLNSLELFGIGASWGGYESLIIPAFPDRYRTATQWNAPGPLLRLHAGLESPADLIADLEHGFNQLGDQAPDSTS